MNYKKNKSKKRREKNREKTSRSFVYNDIIRTELYGFDQKCRDKNHTKPKTGVEQRKQFILNLIDNEKFDPHDNENYIEYTIRLNQSTYSKSPPQLFSHPDLKKHKNIIMPSPTNDIYTNEFLNKYSKFRYVGDLIYNDDIKSWKQFLYIQDGKIRICHDKHIVYIMAGTGKGKNHFISNYLLRFTNANSQKIVMFVNRSSLYDQQLREFIKNTSCISSNQDDIILQFRTSGSVHIGKNLFLSTYQSATNLLIQKDHAFLSFLGNADYAVFDEIHYLFDDSGFNKNVNIFIDEIIKGIPRKNGLLGSACSIFLSATMEELLLTLNRWKFPFPDIEPEQEEEFLTDDNFTSNDITVNTDTFMSAYGISSPILDKSQNKQLSAESQGQKQLCINNETSSNAIEKEDTTPQSQESQDYIRQKINKLIKKDDGNDYIELIPHIYYLQTDYRYISPHCYKQYDDIIPKITPDSGKWLIFVDSKEKGAELCDAINATQKDSKNNGIEKAVFINADNRKNTKEANVFSLLNKKAKFNNQVLIATSVIYNGINIFDDALKNIVLPFLTVPMAKQCIGRKRLPIKNKHTRVNVYFFKADEAIIKSRMLKLIDEYQEVGNLKNISNSNAINIMNGNSFNQSKYLYLSEEDDDEDEDPFSQQEYQKKNLQIKASEAAMDKLHFETMFTLYLLKRFRTDENAYVNVMLESLNIKKSYLHDASEDGIKIMNQKAIEEIQRLVSKYQNHITDQNQTTDDDKKYYPKVLKLKEELEQIYANYGLKNRDKNWRSPSRFPNVKIFNEFADKIGLSLQMKIEKSKKAGKGKTVVTISFEDCENILKGNNET